MSARVLISVVRAPLTIPLALAALVIHGGVRGGAWAVAPLGAVVTVRVFNLAEVPPGRLSAALATAQRLFREAGVTVEWLMCQPTEARAGCDEPPPEALMLRIVPGSAGSRSDISGLALGYAALDTAGAGVMATVFAGSVQRLADESQTLFPRLLGRVIAHELGHLLLQTTDHAIGGVMRAGWRASALRRSTDADWRFTATERDRLRRRFMNEDGEPRPIAQRDESGVTAQTAPFERRQGPAPYEKNPPAHQAPQPMRSPKSTSAAKW